MPRWTARQQAAIDARNPRVLVSAAAGSGKTSVLVARVLSMLREGMSLDRLLILTFTNAAAGEMRSRLAEKLAEEAAENPALRSQLYLVDRADISTLHSFCKKLVQRYFHAAGTDPNSRIADEQAARALFDKALDEALDALYENPGEDDRNLIDRFKEAEIAQMTGSLHGFLMAQADPWGWMEESVRCPDADGLMSSPWGQVMRREAELSLQGARSLAEEAEALCLLPSGPARYLDALQDDQALIRGYLRALAQGEGCAGPPPAFTRLPTRARGEEDPGLAARAKDLRDAAKEAVKSALSLLPANPQEAAAWAGEIALTLPALRALSRLTREVHERYQQLKAERTLWDYNDLEHFALRALSHPDVAEEAAGCYDALFIDEYQDISHIQEALIRRLHGRDNSLFMVGDVKQSIYRFRLADPGLFLAHQRRFSGLAGAQERLITLKENFRSQPNILSCVNLVFENTMREAVTEIDYDAEARLVSGRESAGGEPVELWLIDREGQAKDQEEDEAVWEGEAEERDAPAPDADSAFDYEARLIAQRIRHLRQETIPGPDGSPRPIRYQDMAVLLRSGVRRAAALTKALGEAGIPAYSDTDAGFFSLPEVRDAVNLLRVLDNPWDDEALLAVLASPVCGFSPRELASLRRHNLDSRVPLHRNFSEMTETSPRVREAARKFSRWRFLSENMPLERFVRRMLRESGLYARAGARPEGELRRANLRLLASLAAPAPDPQSLHDFIKRADSAAQDSRQRSASLGEQEDVVRVMTLHKSKGLEFPVVFLPDLAAQFSKKQDHSPLMADAATGLALILVKPEDRLKKDTFATRAMAVKKSREEKSEEARLLYVGMTRARERLILVASPANPEAALARWARGQNDYAVAEAGSMLDWIGACLHEAAALGHDTAFEKAGSRWTLYRRGIASLPASRESAEKALPDPAEGPPAEEICALFAAPPPGPALPLKSSVTALVTGRLGLAASDEEETPDTKRRELAKPLPMAPLPRLGDERPLTAAQRGIATHRALGALDPAGYLGLSGGELAEKLRMELDELAARGLIRQQERQALEEEAIAGFLGSDLARRMARSPECHREWPFTLRVEGGMLLQGVLDACFLEEGAWVLVDYKTDRGDRETLRQKYEDQMRWYMRALRDITALPVKEAWLYLLMSREAAEVTEERPIRLRPGAFLPPMAE